MRTGIKIIICTALLAIAVTMAVFTMSGFEQAVAAQSPPGGSELFILGEAEGNVAIFGGDGKTAVAVTDIELSSLREADRELISAGLPVESEEELMRLLEDLGS